MSSALPSDPAGARSMLGGIAGKAIPDGAEARVANGGLSPRQQHLDQLYRYFRAQNYDVCKIDWDGKEIVGSVEHEQIATQGAVPAGFYDAGQSLPLKFRRPTAPFYLARVIVWRFTGLLFGTGRHPTVRAPGDDDTTSYLEGLIEAGRLWPAMLEARNFGGAMGSVAVGFSLVQGKPLFEVFDPRWCTPTFEGPTSHELEQLEVRYLYPDEVRDPETGQWVEGQFWYRRVLTKQADTIWPKVPYGDGDEPRWQTYRRIEVEHGLGEVPVVWMQNEKVPAAIDGDPDCHGAFDSIELIDRLIAQGARGVVSNCDPTLKLSSDAEWSTIKKGSDNALHLEKGGDASYLEIDGKGPEAAFDKAEKLEARVCKMTRCVIEDHRTQGGGGDRTATEVDRDYSPMWERADVFREQYGEVGVKRLLEKALKLVRLVLGRTTLDVETGDVVRERVILPPKPVTQPDGTTRYVERTLGQEDAPIQLAWPPYVKPTLQDAMNATTAAGSALLAGLIDREHAARFVASYFQVENVNAMLERIEQNRADTDAAAAAYALRNIGPR